MSRHGTPLRYPGGKQKISPFIREILQANDLLGGHYVEPYAGGAGVAIQLLLDGDVAKIHLNDSCEKIYAIWWSILNEPEAFCRKIRSASLTVEEWRRQQAIMRSGTAGKLEVGFSAFYLNRVNRSGILTGGLIGGLMQTGTWKMDARFPRNELIRRVELIASKKKKIAIRNWDSERFIADYLPRLGQKSLVYFDPPYYRKAERLYLNHYSPDDHARLAEVIQNNVSLPWLVSYDGAAEIQELYKDRKSFLYLLQYNAARCYEGSEFFAFSDKLTIPKSSSLSFIHRGLASVV
jgi:DNA adenine methylase